jgi:SOS-response transcriptional repressor LexA
MCKYSHTANIGVKQLIALCRKAPYLSRVPTRSQVRRGSPPQTPFYELGKALKNARLSRNLAQREVARATGMSLRQVAHVEAGENVSLSYIEKLVELLGVTALPIGRALVEVRSGDVTRLNALREDAAALGGQIAEMLQQMKFEEVARDDRRAIVGTLPPAALPEGAKVLSFPEPSNVRITLAEEEQQMDELRRAFTNSPDAEWRKPFRGKKKYVVPRGIDAAAGFGAELLPPLEEEEQLREIPEHYWEERGARMVLRARGNSLILRGIVDRDLLFIRPAALPNNDDIIVCRVNTLAFVKIFERKGDAVQLKSANPQFGPINVHPSDSFHCFGVVVGRSGYGLRETEELK